MITKFQYQEMLSRTSKNKFRNDKSEFEPCEREVGRGGLHEKIENECKKRLWPIIHSRTDMASTTGLGVVDFVIAAQGGRTFYIECKSGKSKQTIAQKGFQMMLEMNGHKYHLCRSFEEFLSIVNL